MFRLSDLTNRDLTEFDAEMSFARWVEANGKPRHRFYLLPYGAILSFHSPSFLGRLGAIQDDVDPREQSMDDPERAPRRDPPRHS
jgi:hypothetical protein